MQKNDINMKETLERVLRTFKIDHKMIGYEEISLGHINSTYRVYVQQDDGEFKSYIVQKINTYVFTNPKAVMKNIDLVTEYIRQNNPEKTLHFHHTLSGKNYIIDGTSFWRLYTYVDGSSINGEVTEGIMEEVGAAFGQFQDLLANFDASSLKEVIPNFHNTKKRYAHLLTTIENDPIDRVETVKEEIEIANELSEIALRISEANEKGLFPIRITHNDTKTNNVLLDAKTNKPLMVIDLDTVMPGLIMHDFGDAIRYGANTAVEDEKDLSKVSLSLPLFESFTKGFVGEVKNSITESEVEYMALGAITMTYECGIRFLDDYIDGDKYFKTSYDKHNLDRARCQFALAKDMVKHLDEMNAIVKKYAAK